MAGAGYKSWVDGDILTAADVNTYLMQQAVMRFADSAARTSAIAAPSEGMVTYLVDTDRIEYYDGAAWQPILDQDVIEAKGDLIVGTADDAVSRLAVGTDGYVLTADSGETTGLKWAVAGGGGKVVQVVSADYSTQFSTTSTTNQDTGLTATITPTSASNKILVLVSQSLYIAKPATSGSYGGGRLMRDATAIIDMGSSELIASYAASGLMGQKHRSNYMILDNPATTSATTYKTQIRSDSGETVRSSSGNTTSSIILLEVAP